MALDEMDSYIIQRALERGHYNVPSHWFRIMSEVKGHKFGDKILL